MKSGPILMDTLTLQMAPVLTCDLGSTLLNAKSRPNN
jgi:hypothetical protein